MTSLVSTTAVGDDVIVRPMTYHGDGCWPEVDAVITASRRTNNGRLESSASSCRFVSDMSGQHDNGLSSCLNYCCNPPTVSPAAAAAAQISTHPFASYRENLSSAAAAVDTLVSNNDDAIKSFGYSSCSRYFNNDTRSTTTSLPVGRLRHANMATAPVECCEPNTGRRTSVGHVLQFNKTELCDAASIGATKQTFALSTSNSNNSYTHRFSRLLK